MTTLSRPRPPVVEDAPLQVPVETPWGVILFRIAVIVSCLTFWVGVGVVVAMLI